MNLVTLHGHTIDEARLPARPAVLDVGSRNYGFTNALLEIRPLANIVCLEPDPLVKPHPQARLYRNALVGDNRVEDEYYSYSTGEGNCLKGDTRLSVYPDWTRTKVHCIRLPVLGRSHWDLIKLDCEGSEFGILENWPESVTADQITVEFHDYQDRATWEDAYFAALFAKLPQFEVVQHEDFQQGCAVGHWDSLLVRRKRAD